MFNHLRLILSAIILLILASIISATDMYIPVGGVPNPYGYTNNNIRYESYSGGNGSNLGCLGKPVPGGNNNAGDGINDILGGAGEEFNGTNNSGGGFDNRGSGRSTEWYRRRHAYEYHRRRLQILQRPHSVQTQSAPHEFNHDYANVDMLLGNLFFTTTDFYLEGRNGIDLEVSRVYTSRVSEFDTTSWSPFYCDTTESWYFGQGWWWFLGRIDKDSTIHYGNGSSEKPMINYGGSSYYLKTGSFELMHNAPLFGVDSLGNPLPDSMQAASVLLKQDGKKYSYRHVYDGLANDLKGKYLTRIEDPQGANYISVKYLNNSPLIDTVYQYLDGSINRKIWFEYSDTTDANLLSTRLKKLYYYDSDGDIKYVEYHYDDDDSTSLYTTNPLIMVCYPNNDTISYAYTDSAYLVAGNDTTNYYTGGYRLSEVILPDGGKVNYDWQIYREIRWMYPFDPANWYYWHINVTAIRLTDLDNSVDTLDFNFDYGNGYIMLGFAYGSYVKYPDSSAVLYWHTPIKPCPISGEQISGLLKGRFYYDKLTSADPIEDTANFAILTPDYPDYFAHPDSGYTSYIIGRDIETDSLIAAPFLTEYKICYNVREFAEIAYSSLHKNSNFNAATGLFLESRDIDQGTISKTAIWHSSSTNWTVPTTKTEIDSLFADTIKNVYYWDYDSLLVDSQLTIAGGDTIKTEYVYNDMRQLTRLIKPLGDTLYFQYADSFVNPITVYNSDYIVKRVKYKFHTNKIDYIVNANNDTTFYTYDDNTDRLVMVKSPMEDNYSKRITYVDANNLVIDSLKLNSTDASVSLSYHNGFGQACSTKIVAEDQAGDTIWTVMELDYQGRIKRLSRSYSDISDTAWTEFDYGAQDNILKITDPLGNDMVFKDSTITDYLLKVVTDKLGYRTIKKYNTAMQLVEVWSDSAYRDTVRYQYGSFGRLAKIIDPRGLETNYWYDKFGNIDSMYSVDEGLYKYYHDHRGRIRFVRNSVGTDDWLYNKYDKFGRLIEYGTHTNIDIDSVNSIGYPGAGDMSKTVLAVYAYDAYSVGNYTNTIGRLSSIDDETGKTWFYYDDRGRITHKKAKLDDLVDTLHTYYEYEAGNQLVRLTYPDSSQISYDYYNSGRVSDIPGFFGAVGIANKRGFGYEPWGALSKITYLDTSLATYYQYNSLGMTTKILTGGLMNTKWGREYLYDDAGMITLERQAKFEFESVDTLAIYDYDQLYRLKSAELEDQVIEYAYDKSGNLVHKIATPGDSVYYNLYYDSTLTNHYTYYGLESVICTENIDSSIGFVIPAYSNDLLLWSFSSEASKALSEFYIYTSSGDTLVDESGSGDSGSVQLSSTDTCYLKIVCNCISECDYSGSARLRHYDSTSVEYHYTNQVSHVMTNGCSEIPGTHVWDSKGCLIQSGFNGKEYFFDEANHLDSVYIGGNKRLEFEYNASGMRVKKVEYLGNLCDHPDTCFTAGEVCDTIPLGSCDYVPGDANNDGNLTLNDLTFLVNYFRGSIPTIPDPRSRADANCSGDVTGADVTRLNAWFSGTIGRPSCCYWSCADTIITYYIYSGSQVIAEYDEDGNLIDNYVYMGDQRLARFNTAESRKEYYINDIRGSVAMILDSTGSTVASMDYYPYGSVKEQFGDSRLKYTGKELDYGYGFDLYYYGARYYNSEWGRFISPDPLREFHNQYSYCWDNPVNVIDRDGRGGSGFEGGYSILTSWGYDDPIAAWDLDLNLSFHQELEVRMWLAEIEEAEEAEEAEAADAARREVWVGEGEFYGGWGAGGAAAYFMWSAGIVPNTLSGFILGGLVTGATKRLGESAGGWFAGKLYDSIYHNNSRDPYSGPYDDYRGNGYLTR